MSHSHILPEWERKAQPCESCIHASTDGCPWAFDLTPMFDEWDCVKSTNSYWIRHCDRYVEDTGVRLYEYAEEGIINLMERLFSDVSAEYMKTTDPSTEQNLEATLIAYGYEEVIERLRTIKKEKLEKGQ